MRVKRDTLERVGMRGSRAGMFKEFRGDIWMHEQNVMEKLANSRDFGWQQGGVNEPGL